MASTGTRPLMAENPTSPSKINRQSFFDFVRKEFFNGKLSQGQVDGMSAILDQWEKKGFTDKRWLAYMLATVYHETAKTMSPIEEFGRGQKYAYGQKVTMERKPYQSPDKLYYGRGFVQITWYDNYQNMGKILNVNLLEKPELALEIDVATQILFEGMTKSTSSRGDFTGKCVENFFNDTTEDWVGARKIINGKDKAEKIAEYAQRFMKAFA